MLQHQKRVCGEGLANDDENCAGPPVELDQRPTDSIYVTIKNLVFVLVRQKILKIFIDKKLPKKTDTEKQFKINLLTVDVLA